MFSCNNKVREKAKTQGKVKVFNGKSFLQYIYTKYEKTTKPATSFSFHDPKILARQKILKFLIMVGLTKLKRLTAHKNSIHSKR